MEDRPALAAFQRVHRPGGLIGWSLERLLDLTLLTGLLSSSGLGLEVLTPTSGGAARAGLRLSSSAASTSLSPGDTSPTTDCKGDLSKTVSLGSSLILLLLAGRLPEAAPPGFFGLGFDSDLSEDCLGLL